MHRIFPVPPPDYNKPRITSRSRSSITNGREQRQIQRLEREETNLANQQLQRLTRQQDFSFNHNSGKPKLLPTTLGISPRVAAPLSTTTVKFGISNILQSKSSTGRVRFDELLAEEEMRLRNQRSRGQGHDEELELLIGPKVFKIPESRHSSDKDLLQRLSTPPSRIQIPKEYKYRADRGEIVEDDLENEINNYVVPSEEAITSHGDVETPYSSTNLKLANIEIKPISVKLRPKRLKTATASHLADSYSSSSFSSPFHPKPTQIGPPKLNRAAAAEKAYKPAAPPSAVPVPVAVVAAVEPKVPIQPKITVRTTDTQTTEVPEPCACASAAEECTKCSNMTKKFRKEVETSRNLQRQNGCLEGIITQKRNLVEQLSKQVRVLMKENFQLAKGMQALNKVVKGETNNQTESSSATNISTASSTAIKPPTPSEPVQQSKVKSPSTKSGAATKRRSKASISSRSQPGKSRKTPPTPKASAPVPTQTVAESDRAENRVVVMTQEVTSLKNAVEVLQFKLNLSTMENADINAFLSDLLYTLNARGYETVTDHKGNIVDLYRCRGEHLLDLKGRDARARTPVKKLVQQENLLKAVIGSQERFIQSLMVQIQDKQKDALLGKRLSSESSSLSNEGSPESAKSAAMEHEILILIKLLGSACERCPEVYCALRDEQHDATIANGAGNLIVEAVLDRHERVLNAAVTARQRNRDVLSSRSDTPPPHRKRSLTAEPRPREGLTEARDNSYQYSNNNSSNSQGPTIRYAENLSLLNLQKSAYGPVPSHSQARSSSRRGTYSERLRGALRPATTSTNFLALSDNLNLANNGIRHGLSSPPLSSSRLNRPVTSTADGSGSSQNLTNPKRHSSAPSPSKCSFCGERFPLNATLSEINDHINLHLFSEDK